MVEVCDRSDNVLATGGGDTGGGGTGTVGGAGVGQPHPAVVLPPHHVVQLAAAPACQVTQAAGDEEGGTHRGTDGLDLDVQHGGAGLAVDFGDDDARVRVRSAREKVWEDIQAKEKEGGMSEDERRALKRRNLEPVATGTVERNTVEVTKAVADIVPANANAIVQISAYKSCAAFIRAARKAGFGGTFYNVSFVGTQALADELGREARGVMVSQVMPYPYTQSIAVVRDYLEQVRKSGGTAQANYSSMEGYIAARLVIEGLKRARTLTSEGLINGLESLQNFSLGGFPIHFGPGNRVASKFVELSMLTEDGGVRR